MTGATIALAFMLWGEWEKEQSALNKEMPGVRATLMVVAVSLGGYGCEHALRAAWGMIQ